MKATPGAEIKSCCAATYAGQAARFLLGESLHPGGLAMTRRLAWALKLRAAQRVLDVGSGLGTSALLISSEFDVQVDGIDLTEASVQEATAAAQAGGVAERVVFHLADAEQLPFAGETFDAVLCECSWCLFPDKALAAAEFARVLRPGGRVGITDVTITDVRLIEGLSEPASWIACLAGARTAGAYTDLLNRAGLVVTRSEQHHGALAELIGQVEARLKLARALARSSQPLEEANVEQGLALAARAARAVKQGALGYCLLVAHRPA